MLNNHSRYSFTYGTVALREMLAWAREQGLKELALTDINNTAAGIEFVRLAKEEGIKPVLGVDFRNGMEQQYVMLARNNSGFANINRFLSQHLMAKEDFPARAPELTDVFIIYPFLKRPEQDLRENELIGIHPSELLKLKFLRRKIPPDKLCILHTQSFRHKRDHNTHRLLRAIGENSLLSKLANNQQAPESDCYLPPNKLKSQFSEFPKLYRQTRQILEACTLDFEVKNYQYIQRILFS